VAAFLITFLLFGLFLIVAPFGISPFEAPKVILAEVAIELLLILTFFPFKKHHFKKLINPQSIFILILFVLSMDGLLLFFSKDAFFGNPYRLQGVFLLWHLLIFSIISKDYKMGHYLKIILPISFICLFLGTIILGVNENSRAFGTLGESNALAAASLFIFPYLFFTYKGMIRIASIIITLAIILLSGSRAGLVGFIIQIIFLILIKFFKIKVQKAVILSFIFIVLSLGIPFTEEGGWFENRNIVWRTSLLAGLDSPLIGHGFGNIQSVIHTKALELNNNLKYQVVDSAHNFILDFWIQGGIVALVSVLMLIALATFNFIKHKKILELTAIFGIIVAMSFNPVSVANLLSFWYLLGQGFQESDS